MSEMRNLARVAMAAKLLGDTAKEDGGVARAALAEAMADSGVERVRVHGDDEADFGTVVAVPGRRSAVVTDEAAFAEWVARQYPDQVTQAVRPVFRDRLLTGAARRGDPVDPDTGEVMPGVQVQQGDPYLVAKPSPVARERMRVALAAHGLLALGSTEQEDAA